MTGPNPDAELDEALGVVELPPAAVTEVHVVAAMEALFPGTWANLRSPRVREATVASLPEVHRTAQAIADAEQRGAARVLATQRAAGTAPPG